MVHGNAVFVDFFMEDSKGQCLPNRWSVGAQISCEASSHLNCQRSVSKLKVKLKRSIYVKVKSIDYE